MFYSRIRAIMLDVQDFQAQQAFLDDNNRFGTSIFDIRPDGMFVFPFNVQPDVDFANSYFADTFTWC